MTQLRHPNCCAVYDYGEMADGAPYFTMEVVPGQGLDEALPIAPGRFPEVLAQLLLALGYVHQQGLVHCDIKSANVRVRPDGTVKLMDFGLMDHGGRAPSALRGTLPYVSPEMIRRTPIDRRSDLYSVGCLAYELLAGTLPFARRTVGEVLRAHIEEAPTPPAGAGGEALGPYWPLIRKLLAKEPGERHQSAHEALEDLLAVGGVAGVGPVEIPSGYGGHLLTSPFVGRDAEMAALRACIGALEAGEAGEAAGFFISGEAGVGKTRLLEELRFVVQLAGLPFAQASAAESSQTPYGPIAAALRRLLPALKDHAPEALSRHAPVLVKLLPELPAEPAAPMESPRAEALRLQATITALLVALAAHRPVVLVLDNWQWADARSVELLDHLVRNRGQAPLLALVASREASPAALPLIPLALEPLAPASVTRMITSMLGTVDVEAAFLGQVQDLVQGNPLHVEGLLEHLVRTLTLRPSGGRWQTAVDIHAARLPTGLRALLLRNLSALTAPALQLADLIALMGQATDIELLEAASGLEEAALFDALALLQAEQILAKDDQDAYGFVQDVYQEVLVARMAPEAKEQLHEGLLGALERRLGSAPLEDAPLALVTALAIHSLQASRPTKTIAYALEAGRRHLQLFALAEAETFLTTGLVLLDATHDPHGDAFRLDYLSLMGETKRHGGHAREAAAFFEQAILCAEAEGRGGLLGRLLTTLAKCHLVHNEYAAALALCARSEAACLAAGDRSGAARCLLTSGRVHFFRGEIAAARAEAARAAELAELGGDPSIEGQAFAFQGYLSVAEGGERLEAGKRHLAESVRRLAAVGDIPGLNSSYTLLGNAETMLGDHRAAWASFLEARRLCFESGLRQDECVALVNLATTALELGTYREALALARQAVDLATEVGYKLPLGMALAAEAYAALRLGDIAGAAARVDQAVALAHEIANRYLESLVVPYQIAVMLEVGRLPAARAAVGGLRQLIAETGNAEPERRLDALEAELLTREGQLKEAGDLVARALAGAGEAKGHRVQALRVAALRAVAGEAWEEARRTAEEGLALALAIGAAPQAASLHGLLGEVALACGRGGPAGDAGSHFKAMQAHAAEAGDLLQEALARFGLAAAAPYDAQASAQVEAARAALAGLAAGLAAADAEALLSFPERQRVLGGNHVAYSLPSPGAVPRRPPGLGPGFSGMGPA